MNPNLEAPPVESVLVRVTPLDGGNRQIARGVDPAQTLESRTEDVRRGMKAGSTAICEGIGGLAEPDGWALETIEAKFGLTLGAEGSVIVSKASIEACFEVTLTYSRDRSDQGVS